MTVGRVVGRLLDFKNKNSLTFSTDLSKHHTFKAIIGDSSEGENRDGHRHSLENKL